MELATFFIIYTIYRLQVSADTLSDQAKQCVMCIRYPLLLIERYIQCKFALQSKVSIKGPTNWMPVQGSLGSSSSFSWLTGVAEECLKGLRVHCKRVKSYNLCHLYFGCKEHISYTLHSWKALFLS